MIRALVCPALADDFSTLKIEQQTLAAPQGGEVRVRMRAASLNFPDVLMTQGKYQLKPPLPFVPGMEGAGEVVAVGEGVRDVKVGDHVVVASRFGMMASEVNVPAATLRPKAAAMTWAEAASYPGAWLTAYVALVRRGMLQRGETVLVHGAAGGVGMAAVDLGLLLGAIVIATAGAAEKLAVLKGRGAHHVIDYTRGFRDEVKRITNDRGVDVVYDPVGGDVFDESVRCMAFDGRLLVIGFTSGRIPSVSVNMPLIKGFSVVGVRAGEYGRQFPEKGRENVAAVERFAHDGKVKPHIGLSVTLDKAIDAFRAMAERRVIGKAVVTF
ncbi:MAG: NADPH:quinone oxidoreductase family protein [Alphaproteobacteria bacterium]|nr:NADPH:quinone oxidoreductase family protein [Alphaproteobacteria bacterium]